MLEPYYHGKQYTRIGVANHKDLVDLPCVYRPENLMSVERRVTGVDGETLERLDGRFGTLLEHTFPWGLVHLVCAVLAVCNTSEWLHD